METKSNTWKYMILTVTCGIAYLLVFMHRFIPSVIMKDMSVDIAFDYTMSGVLASLYLYVYGFFQFPSGVLTDKFGSRPVLFVSMLILGVGGLLFGFSNSVTVSLVARFLVGLGCAPVLIASLALIAKKAPAEKFSLYSSLLYFLGALGPLVAATPLALLTSAVGWRQACLIMGGFTLGYAVLLYVVLKALDAKSDVTVAAASKGGTEQEGVFRDVFKNKAYLLFLIVGIGAPSTYLVYGGLWASQYLADVYGYTREQYAGVLSFGAVGGVLGFLLAPIIASKIFRSAKVCLGVFGFGLGLSLITFLTPFKAPFSFLSFIMFSIGFLSCGSQVVTNIGIKNMFQSNILGKALGMYNMFPLVCGGLTQVMVGKVLTAYIATVGVETAYAYALAPTIIICMLGGTAAFISIKYK